MLRRLAAVAACVLLLAAVPTGSLYVTTLPTGADVWIDGTYVGRSPLVLGGLAFGRHSVGLTKTGWSPLQLVVSIEVGTVTLSSTRLDPARPVSRHRLPGWIAIHGPVAVALVDGVPAVPAKDGRITVGAGMHTLTALTRRGRITRSVPVWPDTRTDVVIQPDAEVIRPGVVAPAEDYVSRSAIRIVGEKVVVRYGGHEVIAHIGSTAYRVDGKSVEYAEAPTMIGSRLYLPLDLLTTLSSGIR